MITLLNVLLYYAEKQKEKEPAATAFTSDSATRSSKKQKIKITQMRLYKLMILSQDKNG